MTQETDHGFAENCILAALKEVQDTVFSTSNYSVTRLTALSLMRREIPATILWVCRF